MSATPVDVRPFSPGKKWRGTRPFGRGRPKHVQGHMNADELAYAKHLCLRELKGEIAWWKFEAIRLRLADNTTYTPDFIVMLADGSIEFHEFKGFWEEDARAKIKIAAEMYPFPFRSFRKRSQKDGGGFSEEAFGPSVENPKRKKQSKQLELPGQTQ